MRNMVVVGVVMCIVAMSLTLVMVTMSPMLVVVDIQVVVVAMSTLVVSGPRRGGREHGQDGCGGVVPIILPLLSLLLSCHGHGIVIVFDVLAWMCWHCRPIIASSPSLLCRWRHRTGAGGGGGGIIITGFWYSL